MDLHERATSFGGAAEDYDRFRPSYPPAVVDMVVEHGPTIAVDAGCGTGKAATLVAARGVDVLGVEPDPRMAAVARSRGIDVVISTIENWDPVPCDVLFSAQAWHWVDPDVGARRAASAIRRGGTWTAFWNYEADDRLDEICADVFGRWAPELEAPTMETVDHDLRARIGASFVAVGGFDDMTVRQVDWVDALPTDAIVARLQTHSVWQRVEPARRSELARRLQDALGPPGEIFELAYTTRVFSAVRTGT